VIVQICTAQALPAGAQESNYNAQVPPEVCKRCRKKREAKLQCASVDGKFASAAGRGAEPSYNAQVSAKSLQMLPEKTRSQITMRKRRWKGTKF